MLPVTQIADLSPAATGGTANNRSLVDSNEFLMLFIEQLKAQDPLEPQSASEFSSQLAQFASVEQLTNLNTSIETLTILSLSQANMQLAGLLGNEITASGAMVGVAAGQATTVRYDLGAEAASATIKFLDADGNVVATRDLTELSAGANEYVWDAQDSSGAAVPDGVYSLEIEAIDANGDPVSVTTYQTGRVTGVVYENGIAFLEVGERRIAIADVLSVRL
jgi:flagellar basal-body rod modification protein FlgD